MSSTNETGHAKNEANFQTLISFVKAYGATYNPSKIAIHLGNLQAKAKQAKDTINNINQLLPAHSNAVAIREIAFEPLSKLSTKIINSLKATDTPQQVIDNATTNHRKLQGKRATAILSEEEKKTLLSEGKVVNQISTAQLSYDNLLDNFYKQIQLLASIPQYTPNETELKVATLTAQYNDLKAKNDSVVNQNTGLSNARIARNEVLYNKETGLVATASDVKLYIKSVFGPTSSQYKQISGLTFTHVRV
ncbi:hypothetical protein [Pedobacter boryungensis]|uniref:Uncharacterized protein n=1 Tax=Pedobacter boryungensis TaxID=869962 RepID=A0ABX2DFP5_9SPHI|nr:hypothetical protein [Pedobacter boryungensis]NQX31796.1 hypothetical protein [Pedobacter boryungensis]